MTGIEPVLVMLQITSFPFAYIRIHTGNPAQTKIYIKTGCLGLEPRPNELETFMLAITPTPQLFMSYFLLTAQYILKFPQP